MVPGVGRAPLRFSLKDDLAEVARLLVEAFLLDFEGDLYGRELRLAFLSRLRGELKFDSIDELVVQMARDVDDTRRIAA